MSSQFTLKKGPLVLSTEYDPTNRTKGKEMENSSILQIRQKQNGNGKVILSIYDFSVGVCNLLTSDLVLFFV